jgi:hypothetical protein
MRELSVGKNLTANVANTMYTVPKGCKGIVTLLFVANGSGNTQSFSAAWHDYSENTNVTIAASKSLGAGEYVQFSDGRVVLDEYDYLYVTPAAGSTFSAIVTFEIYQNTAYQNGNS